ncbi:MAG: PIG-L family deacetylase, partial [Shimia sp.]
MPTEVQDRLTAEAARPFVAELWRALAGLRSTVRFMNTGAHPDDETSGMLAALWLRDGVNLSYACSTRGEGGQNDIGTEAGTVLGTLRTAEMERAAEALDMVLYWHGEAIDDPITDFGFSKSGTETLGHWGHEALLARFVKIVRTDRPDILCPTFLDVPGQHGHHRAMTQAAHEVIALAADPAFPCDLPPWQVSKLYLPAFGGGGGAYDDEVPPPPETLRVAASGVDPVLGHSYARIGQHSRMFHRTQGMGHWVPAGAERDYPLHLAWSGVGADVGDVWDNLPGDLRALGLDVAQDAIDAAVAAYPDAAAVAAEARRTHAALGAEIDPNQLHRVERKRAQLARVLRLCAFVDARARPARRLASPGETVPIATEHRGATVTLDTGPGARASEDGLTLAPDAPPSDAYPALYDPLIPAAPRLAVDVDGVTSHVPLEAPLLVLPATRARLSETAAILNLATGARRVVLSVADLSPGTPAFALPEGWSQDWTGANVTLTAPEDAAPGLHECVLTIDGAPARTVAEIAYPHTAPRLHHAPASLRIRLAHITPPAARVAYVGAGSDRVAPWLRAAGFDVTDLSDADLAGEAPFAGFDTVLVGVFAYRFRPALKPVWDGLRAWVRGGGTLVTLYHRPWDDWDPETVPPARLEIGQPSLRWRVTDQDAPVEVLTPDHPALTTPNAIGPDDWAGWHKERGLYFAKSWDAAYTPLLSMADPGEAPLEGALLVGEIGAGRHVHVALNLHHQVTQLVPGAY